MDKQLVDALKKVMNERAEMLGTNLDPAQSDALVLKLSDQEWSNTRPSIRHGRHRRGPTHSSGRASS